MLKFNINIDKESVIYTQIHKKSNKHEEQISAQEFVSRIVSNWKKKHLIVAKIIFGFLCAGAIFSGDLNGIILMSIIFAIIIWRSNQRKKSNIIYKLSGNLDKRYTAVAKAFENLNKSVTVFPDAGKWGLKFIKTNVDIYGYKDPTDNDEIFFLPDMCLVNVKMMGFEGIKYSKLNSNYVDHEDKTQFPDSDSEVLGTTWQYTRKDGMPDKRYSNNPKVYKVKKGFVLISDDPKYNIKTKEKGDAHFTAGLIVSSPAIAKRFNTEMNDIFVKYSVDKSSVKKKDSLSSKSNIDKGDNKDSSGSMEDAFSKTTTSKGETNDSKSILDDFKQ